MDDYKNWRTTPYIETINKINTILLSNNFITTTDEWFWNSDISTYQCKVFDKSKEYRTCGKGTSPQACLASGLAEYIERIQGLFLIPRKRPITPFFKDEFQEDGVNKLPWLNLMTGEVVNKEYTWETNLSHGFAAGNTYEEALIHSMAEVAERDAMYKYVNDEIVFHNIIQLSGELQKRAINIEKRMDGTITFFDITPYHIPTVLMIFEPFDAPDMLVFYIQSSASIELAIERCITESFQLSVFFHNMFHVITDMPLTKDVREGFAWVKMTAGVKNAFFPKIWADKLFELKNTLPVKKLSSYIEFKNEEEFIQTFLNDYKEDFGNIYVRDFGWLGFPTIQLVTEKRNLNNYEMFNRDFLKVLVSYYGEGICNNFTHYNREIVSDFYKYFHIPANFYDDDSRQFDLRSDISPKNRFNYQSWERENEILFLEDIFGKYFGTFSMDMDYFRQFCLK